MSARADGGANIVMRHENINDGSRNMSDYKRPESDAGLSSLEVTDAESKAVQKTPNRVSLQSIKDKIEHIDYINPERHLHMTICLMTMENGFVIVGKSAPADPENFNAELGEKLSYEDAVRQAWPLEAYLLLEKMSTAPEKAP